MTEQPQPLTQAQDHDRRMGRLEGIAEQLDRRSDSIERAIGELRQEVAALNRPLDVQFRWLIGIQFGVAGLPISILSKLP